MTLLPKGPRELAETAIWQDVEFGSYVADLPLWVELARDADGTVLELGAGSGRVSLRLARAGFEVIAVERDPELVKELEQRARGLPVRVIEGDITALEQLLRAAGGPGIGLAIAPLQVVQTLDDDERRRLLEGLASILGPGARCAVSLVDESTLVEQGVVAAPKPDMREVEGWVYYSEPLWVQVSDHTLRMRRLRERVAPGGDLVRRVHDDVLHRISPERIEEEARTAALAPVERREIVSSAYEAGSIVILLERG
jgi:SAM-dependent methyltransferase